MSEVTAPTHEYSLPILSQTIKEILPHRYPFLLVDRIVDLEPGKTIQAFKNVTANEEYFNGHFPHQAVMPGVLQLEAMAQAAALLVFYSTIQDASTKIAYLMSMDKVKFRRLVVPGDRLDLHVEVIKLKRGLCKVTAKATVDGEKASEAVITAAIRDREV